MQALAIYLYLYQYVVTPFYSPANLYLQDSNTKARNLAKLLKLALYIIFNSLEHTISANFEVGRIIPL